MTLNHSPTDNSNIPAWQERAEERQERDTWAKFHDIRLSLSKRENFAKFIADYEPNLSEIGALMASGDWLAASIAFDKLILERAEAEVESEYL